MQKPHERLKRKIEKENLWLFILSLLNTYGGMSGAEIKQELIDRYGFDIGSVTTYKVLYLLERGGYVGKIREMRRKIYSITPRGKQELTKGIRLLRQYALLLEKQKSCNKPNKKRD